jgi:glycosyltransferase involved in cell wall biosynthesis
MVENGVTGFLVPNIDPVLLASKIEEIFSDENNLQIMAEQCRAKAVKEYALDIQAVNYRNLYSTLLNSHGDC